jgi:hypothetical protein
MQQLPGFNEGVNYQKMIWKRTEKMFKVMISFYIFASYVMFVLDFINKNKIIHDELFF